MSKKDYVALANALKSARAAASEAAPLIQFGIALVESRIIDALRADNPKFNADTFRRFTGGL